MMENKTWCSLFASGLLPCFFCLRLFLTFLICCNFFFNFFFFTMGSGSSVALCFLIWRGFDPFLDSLA